ncbi:MAG: hypothetical protein KGY99_00380 [Phycisphaerae bacterium]|nr:hypothetical protein [Phycisphaerae bacterium]
MRQWLALAFLALPGCGAQAHLLGTRGTYLMTVYDVLSRPGETVDLAARLRGGDFLRDRPGYVVRFRRGAGPELFKAAETDESGRAVVEFTPEMPGDYRFTIDLAAAGFAGSPPRPQELHVACRAADEPIAVVDLDRTLVASGFQAVLVGDPEPMPGSVAVMQRLEKDHTIAYLTHRPDFFGIKSRAWLAEHGYPPGPVLLSSVSGFLAGSGAYKTEAIARLRERFSALRVGIGDKVSDALAYHENGLHSILILPMPTGDDPEDYAELALALGRLPDAVDVVTNWDQVARAIFDGERFPARPIEERLERRARQLKLDTAGATSRRQGGSP